MEWLKRMNSVLDYIENNLDGEIDDNKIAMLSASSKGMFQRFFALITDMTLSEYIRKRRLTQAAFDIKNTDAKIIDISIKYGYDSATAFGSAFKTFHGITPSEARTSEAQLQSFHRFTFKLTLSIKGGNDMQYRIIEAEDILQKMASKDNSGKFLQEVKGRNGVKFACDGHRVGVILPEGVTDWDLQDAYFDTGNEHTPKVELNQIFSERHENSFHFKISKEQVTGLLGVLNHADDLTEEFKLKTSHTHELGVCLNVNTMEIIKVAAAKELIKLRDRCGVKVLVAENVRYDEENVIIK